jgi:hypothetical protein
MDYAHEMCEYISYGGLAVGAECCRVHNLEPTYACVLKGQISGEGSTGVMSVM